MNNYVLVGDIGGTNARLALCHLETGILSDIKSFPTENYPSLETVIQTYCTTLNHPITEACLALACPIKGDIVELTNHHWQFSIQEMQSNLKLHKLAIINDFAALSMCVPMLQEKDVIQFGGKEPVKDSPIAIYGAGTGLGVSHLLHVANKWVCFPGEGGHVDFAPNNIEEDRILHVLREERGHVSAERILSGKGLVNIYRGIVKSDQREPEDLQPQDITERALNGSCKDCKETLSLFCIILGRFGGNLALNMGTFGGVYIAGGIVPRFLDFFKSSAFREAFEDKGRFRNYVEDIPVYLICHPNPGLLGAGAYIRQELGIEL